MLEDWNHLFDVMNSRCDKAHLNIHNINNIHLMYENDLRFLEQF